MWHTPGMNWLWWREYRIWKSIVASVELNCWTIWISTTFFSNNTLVLFDALSPGGFFDVWPPKWSTWCENYCCWIVALTDCLWCVCSVQHDGIPSVASVHCCDRGALRSTGETATHAWQLYTVVRHAENGYGHFQAEGRSAKRSYSDKLRGVLDDGTPEQTVDSSVTLATCVHCYISFFTSYATYISFCWLLQ